MEQEEKEISTNGANHQNGDSTIPSKDIFVVMDVIKPTSSENYIISPKAQQKCSDSDQKLVKTRITNELGIFGVLVRFVINSFVNFKTHLHSITN